MARQLEHDLLFGDMFTADGMTGSGDVVYWIQLANQGVDGCLGPLGGCTRHGKPADRVAHGNISLSLEAVGPGIPKKKTRAGQLLKNMSNKAYRKRKKEEVRICIGAAAITRARREPPVLSEEASH